MGVMNRFKDMFKGEDEYDVDGYNDGYDSYDDVADEGGVNESVQAQPQPAARDMRSNGGVLSASALEMKVIKPDRFEAVTQIAEHLLAHKTVVLNLEETNKETIRRNFDFYEPMTVHESSLSPCVHSILAASLGKLEKAQELYRRTARLDLDNINNDTCDGLHITSMAGSWLSIVQGFAGMRTLTGSLSFDPQLPDGWDGYAFKIVYRGRLIEVSVSREGTGLKLLSGEALTVMLHGHEVRLAPTEADA